MAAESWASSALTRRIMLGNRSRDTKPELQIRRRLHALGFRYRVCHRPLPGLRRQVDIVFTRARVAVEVRGCFWHGCPQHFVAPRTNSEYWRAKIDRNMRRDADTSDRLARAGWTLVTVWEHEDADQAVQAITQVLHERSHDGSIGIGLDV